jgi:hypothetical protein
MMWSNKAFGIYMGDVMARERATTREWDVMVEAVARERFDACAPETQTRQARSLTGSSSTVAGRGQVARGAR